VQQGADVDAVGEDANGNVGGGLHWFPIPLNLSLLCTFPLNLSFLSLSPIKPRLTRGCVPKVLKLSSNVSNVSRRSAS